MLFRSIAAGEFLWEIFALVGTFCISVKFLHFWEIFISLGKFCISGKFLYLWEYFASLGNFSISGKIFDFSGKIFYFSAGPVGSWTGPDRTCQRTYPVIKKRGVSERRGVYGERSERALGKFSTIPGKIFNLWEIVGKF